MVPDVSQVKRFSVFSSPRRSAGRRTDFTASSSQPWNQVALAVRVTPASAKRYPVSAPSAASAPEKPSLSTRTWFAIRASETYPAGFPVASTEVSVTTWTQTETVIGARGLGVGLGAGAGGGFAGGATRSRALSMWTRSSSESASTPQVRFRWSGTAAGVGAVEVALP